MKMNRTSYICVFFIIVCSHAVAQNNIVYLKYGKQTDNVYVIADSLSAIYARSDKCVLCYCGEIYEGSRFNNLMESKYFLLDTKPHIENEEMTVLNELLSTIMNENVYMQSDRLYINGIFDGMFTLTFIMSDSDSYGKLLKIIDVNELTDRNVNMRFLIYDDKGVIKQLEYSEILKRESNTYMLNF